MTDALALKLAMQIRRFCPCSVIAIGPAKYNELYLKFRNLNKLLAWGHARAIENVLELQPCKLVISDQFADPVGLKRQLFEKGKAIELQSMVRAEADIAVAAASILARAEFLNRLSSLGREFGMTLPKGASPPVLDAGVRFVKQHGADALAKVAKTHFKTHAQVLERSR